MAEEHREREMEKIRIELARLSEQLASLAAGGEGPAGAAASDQGGMDWTNIKQTLDDAQVHGEKALKDLVGHIERHPVGSAVTAFGLGFLIARLLGGGRRS